MVGRWKARGGMGRAEDKTITIEKTGRADSC